MHIRRETVGGYLRAAGIPVRPPGVWGRAPAKPAKEVITDSGVESVMITVSETQPGRKQVGDGLITAVDDGKTAL